MNRRPTMLESAVFAWARLAAHAEREQPDAEVTGAAIAAALVVQCQEHARDTPAGSRPHREHLTRLQTQSERLKGLLNFIGHPQVAAAQLCAPIGEGESFASTKLREFAQILMRDVDVVELVATAIAEEKIREMAKSAGG